MSVHFDVLYKTFDIRQGFIMGPVPGDPRTRSSETLTRAKSWEVAPLFRYRFLHEPIQPFATGGLSFQKISGDSVTRILIAGTGEELSRSESTSSPVRFANDPGFAFGGGAEMRFWRLTFAPEFRYILRSSNPQSGTVEIPSSQSEFLLGVSYRFFGRVFR
jgi:hypothetical protein